MIDKNEIKKYVEKVLNKKTGKEVVAEKIKDIENGDVSPFFLALFGKKITLTAKVAQSYQTKFGMSLWEQISQKLSQNVGWHCETQYKLYGEISPASQRYIHDLLETKKYEPNRQAELDELRKITKTTIAEPLEIPDSTVDVFIKKPDGTEICIDITTVKPNKKEFRTMKRKLLMWASLRYSQDPDINFEPYIAIPYNPSKGEYKNHGGTYDRTDLLVGDELWKKVSDNQFGINDLIDIFQGIGDELKKEVEKNIK